jgi:hypothetical protein
MPAKLIGLHGTVLIELGEITNPFIKISGAILVLILPGLAAIRSAAQLGVQIRLFFVQDNSIQGQNLSLFSQYLLPAIPTIVALALVAVLIDADQANVSVFLSIGGILGSSIATGIIPAMLYKAVIQKHIKPTISLLCFFRSHLAIILNFMFFIVVLLLYGLVIWDSIIIQIIACTTAAVAITQLLGLFSKLKL